jgi:hypothetical protein
MASLQQKTQHRALSVHKINKLNQAMMAFPAQKRFPVK